MINTHRSLVSVLEYTFACIIFTLHRVSSRQSQARRDRYRGKSRAYVTYENLFCISFKIASKIFTIREQLNEKKDNLYVSINRSCKYFYFPVLRNSLSDDR